MLTVIKQAVYLEIEICGSVIGGMIDITKFSSVHNDQ